MPKLRGGTFQAAVIERYRRRETSVEEAISEILWGAGVSAGTVSNPDEKACKSVEEWRSRPLAGEHPYVFIDGIYLKRSWGGSYENAGILVAIGVDGDGRREAIGCAEGLTGSEDSWRGFLPWLGGRGPRGVRMVTGDKCQGMVGALEEVLPQARYQKRTVHLYRSVFSKVPKQKRTLVATMPRVYSVK